ncbi:MAG: VOC family protein [Pseudomonadota bacterium]|nr:VOC family protein [Pseudomonadota bacterium]
MSVEIHPVLSHMALFAQDVDRMIDFYGRVLGLSVSDGRKREPGISRGDSEIVFLSNEPQVHQQLQLSASLFDDDDCNVVHQVSFRLEDLAELREVARRIVEETQVDLSELDQLDHGNAWSLYFRDPEDNMLELYVETPWKIKHPFAQPFDILQPDDVIIGTTFERVRDAEGVDPWSATAQNKMADA